MMALDFNETYDNDNVTLEIPVTYSINKNFLNDFKYANAIDSEDNFVYRFSNLDINISVELEKYLSSMKYQIIPVLFFYDSNDEILFMMIDSWNDDYKFNFGLKDNKKTIVVNQFETLFSITPGESALQFNFDKKSFNGVYKLSLLNDEYKKIDYMAIKFFNEHSLESDVYHYLITNN